MSAAVEPVTTPATPATTAAHQAATPAVPATQPAAPATGATIATAAAGAGDAKPAGGEPQKDPAAQPQVIVPEKYDLKLPANSVLDERAVERIAAYSKAQGLSNEQAQAVLENHDQTVASELDQQRQAWFAETMNDKELGGQAFAQTAESARRAVERFGDETMKRELDRTGYGNHPAFVRFLAKVGKAMAPDTLKVPGAQPSSGDIRPADVLYPNSNK